ncbi:bone morphogenetic protein 15-like [Pecten maximus]|uniref:bone morphogenetic protein 15-like n=1 Tax=Pecten maximus TaxID=6579 RepID=UPI0014580C84|nr:bone morphogenetic protein 15-like [Pecten maximus]
MEEGFVNEKHQHFKLVWNYSLFYIMILFTCFSSVHQEELMNSLYRNMRYTPEHKQYIPAITLRRFIQFAEADDDPSYRRQSAFKLDYDNYEQIKIFYSKQVGGDQVFNLSGRIGNISKIRRADLIIKDYDHNFERVRVAFPTRFQTQRHHRWKIGKWTIEGYALNVTRRVHNHLRNGHKIIPFRVCVKNRKHYSRCSVFSKFSIALVIQINMHMGAWYEYSTKHMDLLDMLREREKYQIRTKRSVSHGITPLQTTPAPTIEHVESNICHVHPWRVAFHDIGWYNVQAPSGFQANLCFGGCPSPLLSHASLNYTYHSVVVDLYLVYHNMSANGIPPEPCCTPTELGPVSVYYSEDDGSHVLIRLEGMRVIACGCL